MSIQAIGMQRPHVPPYEQPMPGWLASGAGWHEPTIPDSSDL